jgi:iron complex outermembrane receptor protein
LNVAYLHSRFGSFFAEPAAPPAHVPPFTCDPHTGGTSPDCQNLTGEESVYAPKWTANGGLQYAFPLANGDTLTPRVDYAFISTQWQSVFRDGNPGAVPKINARSLVNAQLTYAIQNDWEFTLFATNLFNLHYVAAQNVGLRYAGPPQQIGLRVIKSF